MPGRAVVTSPGGTAPISMPSDPNFMCTGLVTVAPFFGSTKNTRDLRAFAAGFFAWAPANDAEPRDHHEHRRATSCFLIFITRSPFAVTF